MTAMRAPVPETIEWHTPPWVFDAFGAFDFDLDPCSPLEGPVTPCHEHFTPADDGLAQTWRGRVWLNPPYGAEIGPWMRKMALHRRGVALVCARTETDWFRNYVWDAADGILFFFGRLHFHLPDGSEANGNAGAPSCLVAYGGESVEALRNFRPSASEHRARGGIYLNLHGSTRTNWRL